MELLRRTLISLWDQQTADGLWNASSPSKGQSAVTALLVQELFGGEIRCIEVDGRSHYFSLIDGEHIDLTEGRFDTSVDFLKGKMVETSEILSNSDIANRYELFKSRFDDVVDKILPLEDQAHLAIRDPNYVAGTSERPEVAIFSQARSDYPPLPDRRMAPGQLVWMKWTGGPIVAQSSVQSWHTIRFENGNINEPRELSKGTNLFGLNDYWNQVQDKVAGWVSIVRLRDEVWLDNQFYGEGRAYGHSWIFLDTLRKQILWLSKSWEPAKKEGETGRSIPAGLRFRVLRRDSYTCRYCGAKAPDVKLHVDHVEPWVEVLRHDIHNLVAACQPCNLGKSAMSLTPQQIAEIHEENRARE